MPVTIRLCRHHAKGYTEKTPLSVRQLQCQKCKRPRQATYSVRLVDANGNDIKLTPPIKGDSSGTSTSD